MEENKRDIEEILKQINGKSNQTPIKFRDSDVEFEIGSREAEEKNVEEKAVSHEEEEEDTCAAIFDIAEKEENGAFAGDIFRIKSTYVPRFTEATEKYSRVGYESDAVKESYVQEPLIIGGKTVDPTAEIDFEAKSDAKIVNVNSEDDLITDSSTLFKFDGENENQSEPSFEEVAPVFEEKSDVTEVSDEENVPETETDKPEALPEKTVTEESVVVDIEEPLAKRMPERYVPSFVASRENITGVGDVVHEKDKSEFTSSNKRDGVKDRFLDTILSQKVRFIVAAALCLAILIFENIYIFGVDLVSVFHFEGMVNALAIIDFQFVACIFLIALPEIATSVKCLSEKRVKSELFIIPAFVAYIAYLLTVIVKSPENYSLFGLLFAVLALSAIASSFFRTKADFVSFKIISAQGEKKIVDNKFTRTLDSENFALDGVVEEYKSKTARVFKTSFVADFFRRTKGASESAPHVALIALVPLGVSVVISAVVYFIASGFLSAMTAFALVYLVSLPSFSVLARKIPHYFASEEASLEKGALVGENAFFDYSGIDVICFEDTEIFSSEDVNIQRIRLYRSNEDLTKALRQMSALFMNIGGPLEEIFSESLDKKCEAANGIIIKENGLIGEIDGKKVMAGSYDFMISEGVEPPTDDDDGRRSFDATTVMYAAENGTVYAKFYVRYRFSEEFTMLLPTLGEEKIVPLVYTRDPNLTNELMKKLTAGTSTVRILKKNTTPLRDFTPLKVSAGMVSNGDKGNLVNLILLSRRYVKFNARMKVTERSAMIVGLALGALISVGGMFALPSLLLSVWQLAWCAALAVLTKSFFKLPKNKKEKRKNAKQKSLIPS